MICHLFRWRFVSLLVTLLSFSPLGAAANSGWFARAWQTEDGLPEHTIVGLEQTPDGYLVSEKELSLGAQGKGFSRFG